MIGATKPKYRLGLSCAKLKVSYNLWLKLGVEFGVEFEVDVGKDIGYAQEQGNYDIQMKLNIFRTHDHSG